MHSWKVLCATLAVLISGLAYLVFFARSTPVTDSDFIAFAGVIAALLIMFPWSTSRRYRKNYDSQSTMQEEIRMRFDEKAMYLETDSGRQTVAWSSLFQYKIGKDCILLYTSKTAIRIIPCRAFESPEEAQAMETRLRSLGKPGKPL